MANFNKLATLGTPTGPLPGGPQPNIRPPAPVGGMAPGEPDADDFAQAPGDQPPTPSDHKQAITHHISSIKYNAKHASAHQGETAKHAGALLNLLKNVPGFAEHAKKV